MENVDVVVVGGGGPIIVIIIEGLSFDEFFFLLPLLCQSGEERFTSFNREFLLTLQF